MQDVVPTTPSLEGDTIFSQQNMGIGAAMHPKRRPIIPAKKPKIKQSNKSPEAKKDALTISILLAVIVSVFGKRSKGKTVLVVKRM